MEKAMFKKVKKAYRIAESMVDVVETGDSRLPVHSYTYYTSYYEVSYNGRKEQFKGATVGEQQSSYPAYTAHLWDILQSWGLLPSDFDEITGREFALAFRSHKRAQERKRYGW